MSLSPAQLLRGLAVVILMAVWAILAHYASAGQLGSDFSAALAIAPLVAIAVMLLWRTVHPLGMAAGGLLALALLAWLWPALRDNIPLLYYVQHVGTNLALAVFFGRTLRAGRQPLVTRFALFAHNGKLSPLATRYTRQVTVAWTIFFVATALISTGLFWLASANAWSVFANLLGAPLLGVMFAVEHLMRRVVLPPEDRSTIADTIRGYRASQQQRTVPLARHP